MSSDPKRPYSAVFPIAQKLLEKLAPLCGRIELAGSLRRQKPMVGDIEIVAIPKPAQISLDGTVNRPYLTDLWMQNTEGLTIVKAGGRYQQFKFKTKNGSPYTVDLFLQPDPATWGQNFMIRTGSADFSHWMVTPQSQGGAVPCDDAGRPLFRSIDARWYEGATALNTPEETDVFALLGLEWIRPQDRERGRWGS